MEGAVPPVITGERLAPVIIRARRALVLAHIHVRTDRFVPGPAPLRLWRRLKS